VPRTQQLLSIAEASRLLAVPAPTLRSWERRYGFPTPPRTSGKHRRYSRSELELLRALRDEIARGRPARDAVDVVRKLGVERLEPGREELMRFVEAALRLDARHLSRALNASARKRGIEETIGELALPALREIGVRWESGRCTVGHEHLVTEQIEAWLHRSAPLRPRMDGRVVLACGPEDHHRVALDAFAVLLAQRGWDVRVLGAQVPSRDVAAAANAIRANAAVITSHMNSARRAAVASLRNLRSGADAALFYAGHAFVTSTARRGVPGTYLGEDLPKAAEVVTRQLRAVAS
jgi:MerR family transcriptional regulator, light-induced transcriptional regulator